MHQSRGRMGVINLIMKCMSKLNMLYHSGIPCFCEKKSSPKAQKNRRKYLTTTQVCVIIGMWSGDAANMTCGAGG